jgi:hypothetical protein
VAQLSRPSSRHAPRDPNDMTAGPMPKRWKTEAVVTLYDQNQAEDTDSYAEEYDTEQEARPAFKRMNEKVRKTP